MVGRGQHSILFFCTLPVVLWIDRVTSHANDYFVPITQFALRWVSIPGLFHFLLPGSILPLRQSRPDLPLLLTKKGLPTAAALKIQDPRDPGYRKVQLLEVKLPCRSQWLRSDVEVPDSDCAALAGHEVTIPGCHPDGPVSCEAFWITSVLVACRMPRTTRWLLRVEIKDDLVVNISSGRFLTLV